MTMNCNADEPKPKYACQACGSTRLRSELNAFNVFIARGDKLVHVRDEGIACSLQELYCYECGEEIDAGYLGNIRIE